MIILFKERTYLLKIPFPEKLLRHEAPQKFFLKKKMLKKKNCENFSKSKNFFSPKKKKKFPPQFFFLFKTRFRASRTQNYKKNFWSGGGEECPLPPSRLADQKIFGCLTQVWLSYSRKNPKNTLDRRKKLKKNRKKILIKSTLNFRAG